MMDGRNKLMIPTSSSVDYLNDDEFEIIFNTISCTGIDQFLIIYLSKSWFYVSWLEKRAKYELK